MSRVLICILYFSNVKRYSHQKFTDALTLLVVQKCHHLYGIYTASPASNTPVAPTNSCDEDTEVVVLLP